MRASLKRILAMVLRYLYPHQRSLPRTLDVFFWPVMGLWIWGFVALYLKSMVEHSLADTVVFLINGLIFWEIVYRSEISVGVSVVEEIYHQNILNLLVSPLRIWEWLTATFLYALLKTFVITVILWVLALVCYQFNLIDRLGIYLFPLAANLLLFGCVLGIFSSAMLLHWGYTADALIWTIPFLIQPISAVYYPISILPVWLQWITRLVPSTYVFEGMRAVLRGEEIGFSLFFMSFGLNCVFFIFAVLFFKWFYNKALVTGRLVRTGMD